MSLWQRAVAYLLIIVVVAAWAYLAYHIAALNRKLRQARIEGRLSNQVFRRVDCVLRAADKVPGGRVHRRALFAGLAVFATGCILLYVFGSLVQHQPIFD